MRICVYCASSAKIDKVYFQATRRLGNCFVDEDVEMVYGGGATGLMGELADTMLAGGGKVKGIMPQFMNEVEWAHKQVEDFEFTETMHERKAKFLENIDAVVALPGGCGTLEELFEAITLKKLGQLPKPIIILNTNGYYDKLIAMMDFMINEQFMTNNHKDLWQVVDEPEQVLPAIRNSDVEQFTSIHLATSKK